MSYLMVWMYFEEDDEGGRYNIQLFASEQKAQRYLIERANSYGQIEEIAVK